MPGQFALVPEQISFTPNLRGAPKAVLDALYAYRNNQSGLAWPKRSTLAEKTGYSLSSIDKATRHLEELGYIEKFRNTGGCNLPAIYKIRGGLVTGYEGKEQKSGTEELPLVPFKKAVTVKLSVQTTTVVVNPPVLVSDIAIPEVVIPPVDPRWLLPFLAVLKTLCPILCQDILDEFEGALRSRDIHNPRGYLRMLIVRAQEGTFVPELALQVQERRKRELKVEQKEIYLKPKPEQVQELRRALWG